MLSYTFLMTSVIVVLIPGTGVIYTISTGISMGKKESVMAAVGCTLGIIPHMGIGIMVMLIFENINLFLFSFVKIIGSLYLVYLGINMIRSKADIITVSDDKQSTDFGIIFRGVLINLLNPKLTIFFVSFLPQFTNKNSQGLFIQGLILSLVFMAITLFIFSLYGLFAGFLHEFLKKVPQRFILIQRFFGICFIWFALELIRSRI